MPNANHRDMARSREGGWGVKASGATGVSTRRDTRPKAERRVKQIVRRVGDGKLRIHNRDGRACDNVTMASGNDPSPAREATR